MARLRQFVLRDILHPELFNTAQNVLRFEEREAPVHHGFLQVHGGGGGVFFLSLFAVVR